MNKSVHIADNLEIKTVLLKCIYEWYYKYTVSPIRQ